MAKTLARSKKKTMKKKTKLKVIKRTVAKMKSAVKSKKKTVAKSKRATVKKMAKKVTKKLLKKTTAKKAAAPGTVGKVVHYYDKIGVAIVELGAPVTVGELLLFRRGEREFTQPVSSMQIDHASVEKAGRGKIVGIRVVQVADPGTLVYRG